MARFERDCCLLKVKPYRRISKLRMPARTDSLGNRPNGRRDRYVPFIRLSGDWLDDLGFAAGTTFRVSIAGPGTLILESGEV
jgi:hypothetical protein